jgi:Holliday junction resolvase
MSANELTSQIITYLNSTGFEVWRQNVVGIARGRKVATKKGLPDIVGFQLKTGIAVYIEIKVGKDKLSNEQREFLIKALANGCFAIIVFDSFDNFISQLELLKIRLNQ